MGEVLSGIGDLVFSLVIGYIGALQFLYVARHLYHWSFRHATINAGDDADSLEQLQGNIREHLSEAEEKEMLAGAKVMQDGVLYKDGFRIDPQQQEIEKLKDQQRALQTKVARQKELEGELARQRQIEEETRSQLKEAEAKLLQQRQKAQEEELRKEAAEHERKVIEAERQREEEERSKEAAEMEAAENERKLLEAERQREEAQQRKEVEEMQAAENERKLLEAERQREEDQRIRKAEEMEAAENERKLLEAERQRRKEKEEMEASVNKRKLLEAERQREEDQQRREAEEIEAAENERKLLEAERQREEDQRIRKAEEMEAAENERKLLEAERQREEAQQIKEAEEMEAAKNERKLLEAERQREEAQQIKEAEEMEAAENERKLLEAERQGEVEQQRKEAERKKRAENAQFEEERKRELKKQASLEQKRKLIEENARKFLEAEQEMVNLQQKIVEGVVECQTSVNFESATHTPVVEETCIKKIVAPRFDELNDVNERPTQTVKTQIGQTSNELYSLRTKSLHFPGLSDEGSSVDPNSSQKSSFSTQPSDDVTTEAEDAAKTTVIQLPQAGRQEPDGEENTPAVQYTDEYLRSLDGIKSRPLVREDGSGRRRAFKKRRSSGSSNSSRESRASREEEVKMFTSLEEEEMQSMDRGEHDYAPIKYSSESTLKVKGHHRRHKRSPAKDMRTDDDNNSVRGSLEMLGEENTDPWGEVVPEHYKETEFWRREKAMSIDEEEIELEKPPKVDAEAQAKAEPNIDIDAATNMPKTSSFEEATDIDNEEAITTLQKQHSKDAGDHGSKSKCTTDDNKHSDIKSNLQTSNNTEGNASPACTSGSPRLRRSPRIDEIDQYKDRWKESEESLNPSAQSRDIETPTISIQQADNSPWRDQYGLVMEGLSDFYDFSASINPSRSRSTSPMPKNISYNMDVANITQLEGGATIDVYNDTGNIEIYELKTENITDLIESLRASPSFAQSNSQSACGNFKNCESLQDEHLINSFQNVADDNPSKSMIAKTNPMLRIQVSNENRNLPGDYPTDMNELVQALPSERTSFRSRSRSPLPTADNIERSLDIRRNKLIKHNEDILENFVDSHSKTVSRNIESSETSSASECKEYSKENMNLLVETLRLERSGSRSSSRSPLHTAGNIIQQTDVQSSNEDNMPDTPIISIEYVETDILQEPEDTTCSREHMNSLVASLRTARSRSRSKSPMRTPTGENLARSVERRRKKLIEKNYELSEKLISVYACKEIEINDALIEHGRSRSCTPSRSISNSPHNASNKEDMPRFSGNVVNIGKISMGALENLSDNLDFHTMLNLKASQNKTLSKNSEETESNLAQKQRLLDKEALHKFKSASEEVELRTLTPTDVEKETEIELNETSYEPNMQTLSTLKINERLHELRCSPTTPNYDRTISEEWRDVQRIKNNLFTSGFKRSTYVGESMDLGSEYEHLRHEAAHFRRSQSPSRSIIDSDLDEARRNAAEKRQIQNQILLDLITSTENIAEINSNGTTPKVERKHSTEWERSFSTEVQDTQRIKNELLQNDFKRSTYAGESVDLSLQLDNMRHETSEFRRSRSKSRSPLDDDERKELSKIEEEVERRELRDKLLDEIDQTSVSFQDFSRHLNAGFLDNDRRASDSALIQRPEILIQFQDNDADLEMDPDDYHHLRRFSLNQNQPVEEYPSDDYVFVSQIEVRTSTGTRTWIREDYYSDSLDDMNVSNIDASDEARIESVMDENEEHFREEEDTDGSEDERQTVVEVDDEIDEDICDFGERGPADESHHEQSECEEAEREMDRYAERGVDDWRVVEDFNEFLYQDESQVEDGAAGGLDSTGGQTYDSDSVVIDQIYDDAIKNRKQSGILRDYDSILQEMQNNYSEDDNAKPSHNSDRKFKHSKGLETSGTFLENESRDHEVRYLGDATICARQSTRLRSRYGYVPVLQGNAIEEINVDLNYKPKREYNWRKNFKLDDNDEQSPKDEENMENPEYISSDELLDLRKYSLGGESITLFSRSPERESCKKTFEEDMNLDGTPIPTKQTNFTAEIPNGGEEATDKPKKKTKKKLRRDSKSHYESRAEDDSESQIYSRRSSSIQMETISPKRKSLSRRNSKSSVANEDSVELLSPRVSVGYEETYGNINQDNVDAARPVKKKTKKRKKARDAFAPEADIKEENTVEAVTEDRLTQRQPYFTPVSTTISPESASLNMLSTLSPQNSVCVTPASTESEKNEEISEGKISTTSSKSRDNTPNTTATTNTTPTSPIDSFDIMKDANFYPLF